MPASSGACTEIVLHSPSIDMGLLGERFIYYRIPPSTPEDDFTACVVADENAGRQHLIRAKRAAVVRGSSLLLRSRALSRP